jgi:hypothetical protein
MENVGDAIDVILDAVNEANAERPDSVAITSLLTDGRGGVYVDLACRAHIPLDRIEIQVRLS